MGVLSLQNLGVGWWPCRSVAIFNGEGWRGLRDDFRIFDWEEITVNLDISLLRNYF